MAFIWMRILHFTGFTLWISGLFGMAMLMRAGVSAKRAGIVADIGATLALVSGIYRIYANPALMKEGWMHIKLTLVVLLIGVNVALRIKARKERPGSADVLMSAAIAIAFLIFYLIVRRPFA